MKINLYTISFFFLLSTLSKEAICSDTPTFLETQHQHTMASFETDSRATGLTRNQLKNLPTGDIEHLNDLTHHTLHKLESYSSKKEDKQVQNLIWWANFHEKASRILEIGGYCNVSVSVMCYGLSTLSVSCNVKSVFSDVGGVFAAIGGGMTFLSYKSKEAYKKNTATIETMRQEYQYEHGLYNEELKARDRLLNNSNSSLTSRPRFELHRYTGNSGSEVSLNLSSSLLENDAYSSSTQTETSEGDPQDDIGILPEEVSINMQANEDSQEDQV